MSKTHLKPDTGQRQPLAQRRYPWFSFHSKRPAVEYEETKCLQRSATANTKSAGLIVGRGREKRTKNSAMSVICWNVTDRIRFT
jgi:hypothetical protein